MDVDAAIDLVRQATWLGALLCAPVLVAVALVGLVVSVLQAVTQIQEQTLSFVPRLAIATVTALVILPWGLQRLVEYATELFLGLPTGIAG
ncbi:MAG: flagellar biosynthetic protein FliQ [Planctomycetaceae bacterium]